MDVGLTCEAAGDQPDATRFQPSAAGAEQNKHATAFANDGDMVSMLLPPAAPSTASRWWGLPPIRDCHVPALGSEMERSDIDAALQTKLAHFHDLKAAQPPSHFNESLLRNRSFRNPYIHDRLVTFVGINESSWGQETDAWAAATLEDTEMTSDDRAGGTCALLTALADMQRKHTHRNAERARKSIDFAPAKRNGSLGDVCDAADSDSFPEQHRASGSQKGHQIRRQD